MRLITSLWKNEYFWGVGKSILLPPQQDGIYFFLTTIHEIKPKLIQRISIDDQTHTIPSGQFPLFYIR